MLGITSLHVLILWKLFVNSSIENRSNLFQSLHWNNFFMGPVPETRRQEYFCKFGKISQTFRIEECFYFFLQEKFDSNSKFLGKQGIEWERREEKWTRFRFSYFRSLGFYSSSFLEAQRNQKVVIAYIKQFKVQNYTFESGSRWKNPQNRQLELY